MLIKIPCVITALILVIVDTIAAQQTGCHTVNGFEHCFYTDGSRTTWSDARKRCLDRRSTLPYITDENVQKVFQKFLTQADELVKEGHVWIGAQGASVTNGTKWHWLNKKHTAISSQNLLNHETQNFCATVSLRNGSAVLFSNWWTDTFHFICEYRPASNCEGGFVVDSTCFKVIPASENWFTALRRCRDDNGHLASFDDNVVEYLIDPPIIPDYQYWFGLVRSWWIWPDQGYADVQYNKFNAPSDSKPEPPHYPPRDPNPRWDCVIARNDWIVASCNDQHLFVCHTVKRAPPPPPLEEDKDTLIAIVVGVVAGAICLVIIIVIIILCVRKHKKKRLQPRMNGQSTSNQVYYSSQTVQESGPPRNGEMDSNNGDLQTASAISENEYNTVRSYAGPMKTLPYQGQISVNLSSQESPYEK